MDGGQAWKVIPQCPLQMIIKRKMPHSMMFRLKLITQLNLMINGRCARECLTHFSSNGTRYGPYVKLSWDATKNLNFGIRYRYDWKAYRQQDLSGDMSRDNIVGMDMSLTI